jgi:hypothetical protein
MQAPFPSEVISFERDGNVMRVAVMALLASQVPPAPTDVGGTSGSLSVPADTQLRAGGSRGRPKNKQMQQISCSWPGILAGYFRGQAASVPSMCARGN